jgi:hypothetical protein
MDINSVLVKHGIDLTNLKANAENELLKLEPFDDSEYEQRTPYDYLTEVLTAKKEGVYGKALCSDLDDDLGPIQYMNCIITGFDFKTEY